MEQHPVVSDDFVGLVLLARPTLGVAATQVAWGQHSLHAGMPQHGLSSQTHLAEQAFRAATREIKHRFAVGTGGLRVADDGHVVAVFNVQQSPGRFIGQAFGHFFVDEVNHLLFDGRGAHAGWRASGLLANELLQHIVGPALQFKAHLDHAHPHELDGFWIGGIEEHHSHRIAGAECFFAHLAQQVAHVHGDVAKVDLHRAWRLALVAHGAVVGHVFKLLPMLDRHAAAGLLFVQKSFDQQRRGQNFVARAVEQIGAWHMGGTHRLALAAAQAVLDGLGNRANVGLLHDQRLVPHQAKAGRVGLAQSGCTHIGVAVGGLAQQFAFVEVTLRVHARFVIGKGLQLGVAQIGHLGDANAVLARDHAIERARQRHDATHRFVGGLQHVVVVAVDR